MKSQYGNYEICSTFVIYTFYDKIQKFYIKTFIESYLKSLSYF